MYDPHNWYWLASDGRLFSSKRRQIIAEDDADYLAWRAESAPTVWPRNDEGEQTDAALAAVLDPHGLYLSQAEALLAYAADKRWQVETGGLSVGGMMIATDDRSKMMIMGARVAAEAIEDFTTTWVAADGSLHTIDAAAVIGISNAVLQHTALCFSIFGAVKAAIEGGDIETVEEIDAADWPG